MELNFNSIRWSANKRARVESSQQNDRSIHASLQIGNRLSSLKVQTFLRMHLQQLFAKVCKTRDRVLWALWLYLLSSLAHLTSPQLDSHLKIPNQDRRVRFDDKKKRNGGSRHIFFLGFGETIQNATFRAPGEERALASLYSDLVTQHSTSRQQLQLLWMTRAKNRLEIQSQNSWNMI